jgi:hypothetical protein
MPTPVWFVLAELFWAASIVFFSVFERSLRKLSIYIFWRGWRYDSESQVGLQPAANLVGLSIVQLVAFAAYLLRDPNPKFSIGAIYAAVTLIPIVGLGCLVWGCQEMNSQAKRTSLTARPKHTFSRETVVFALASILCLSGLSVGTIWGYAQGKLPFQAIPTQLEFVGARAHEFQEGSEHYGIRPKDPGIAASFQVEAPSMPDPVVIPVSELAGLPKGWRVVNAIGFELADRQSIETGSQPVPEVAAKGGSLTFYWSGLKGGNKYRIDLLLHPGDSKVTPTDVLTLINARKVLVAKAFLGS